MVAIKVMGFHQFTVICTLFSSITSLTLPYMVTHRPNEQIDYRSRSSDIISFRNGTSLYKVNASDGNPCIMLQADALVEIRFKLYVEEEINLYLCDSEHGIIERNCGNKNSTYPSMMITCNEFKLTWSFTKTPDEHKWFVSQIVLAVNVNTYFENIKKYISPKKFFKLFSSPDLFRTPIGRSYASNETVIDLFIPKDIPNPAKIHGRIFLRDFRLQAFLNNTPSFGPKFWVETQNP